MRHDDAGVTGQLDGWTDISRSCLNLNKTAKVLPIEFFSDKNCYGPVVDPVSWPSKVMSKREVVLTDVPIPLHLPVIKHLRSFTGFVMGFRDFCRILSGIL